MDGRLEVYSAMGKVLLDSSSRAARLVGVYRTRSYPSEGTHRGAFVVHNATGRIFAQGVINRIGGLPDQQYGAPGVVVSVNGNTVHWEITVRGTIAWFDVYATIFYGVY